MRMPRTLPALALVLAAAGAGALTTTSHVVIRQVSPSAMACDASTMGVVALNAFAVTSLCSAYVSCEDAGVPVEFPDLAAPARDQARDIDCVRACRCLPPPELREPLAVANETEVRAVEDTAVHRFNG